MCGADMREDRVEGGLTIAALYVYDNKCMTISVYHIHTLQVCTCTYDNKCIYINIYIC